MIKKQKFIAATFLVLSSQVFFANSALGSIVPPSPVSAQEEEVLWNRYCGGQRLSTEIPKPNYNNDEVLTAVKKLALVSPYSFYFYSGPLFAYELKKGKELVDPPINFPQVSEVKNGKKNAHAFMTLLCGEFRDRPSLIQAKIKWVNKMHTLPDSPQKPINVKEDLWKQMSAHSYKSYITNSKLIFDAKKYSLKSANYSVRMGQYNEDYPVEPYTVCETKFIFKKFVETNSRFNPKNLNQYLSEYKKFKNRCAQDDLDHIYDFRGDSNFKPNSPESNGMIWYSSTITNNCTRRYGQYVLKDAAKEKVQDAQICEKYATRPFAYRWAAARAGLATWMLRDKSHDAVFSAEGSPVFILPHLNPMEKPFGFKLPLGREEEMIYEPEKNENGKYITWDDQTGDMKELSDEEAAQVEADYKKQVADLEVRKAEANVARFDFLKDWENSKQAFWERADLGFNQLTGLGTKNANIELVYERLRDAVNRHTDWYSSGYDDGLGTNRDQAYSPFVASSYEMSASDAFTAPGTTVQSPADGCKHWMFVFKLKKDQWYNTRSIQAKTPIDFNKHWFDETSLGTNNLADTEHAFDRLGTALEGEMDSILYLHNITTSGAVDSQCGYAEMGLAVDPNKAVGKK